jgi:hypothetical protein
VVWKKKRRGLNKDLSSSENVTGKELICRAGLPEPEFQEQELVQEQELLPASELPSASGLPSASELLPSSGNL